MPKNIFSYCVTLATEEGGIGFPQINHLFTDIHFTVDTKGEKLTSLSFSRSQDSYQVSIFESPVMVTVIYFGLDILPRESYQIHVS